MRVLSRIMLISEDIALAKTRKVFEGIIREIISKEDPSSFNQGLMELGALICTPKSPSCLLCPVQTHCQAFAEGVEDELPIKSKKKKPKKLTMAAIILTDENDDVLIHRRPSSGLLANLWELPNHETKPGEGNQEEQLTKFLVDEYNITASVEEHLHNFEHVFTHLVWKIAVYKGVIKNKQVLIDDQLKLVSKDVLKKYPFPVSHQKIINSFILFNE
jgi:A/G-specific adenine glycosylase